MKKQVFFVVIMLTAVLFSCRKSNIETVKTVSLSVQVGYNAEDSALGLSKAGVAVKVTNIVSGQVYNDTTNAGGVALFANLTPSNYTVVAGKNLTAEEYKTITGIAVAGNVAFNATETQAFNDNSSLKLQLQSGKIGDLVVKQFYYAGSNTSTGASFRDAFVEIYNNSNQTIYLDSLYIGNTYSTNTALSAGGVAYDWTKSVGITAPLGDANKNYLYFRYLFMIPGTGKQHPLAPGKSFILAETGINHGVPYTDNSGVIQGITNPALTVDLSKADFETYMVDYKKAEYTGTGTFSPYRWDLDNPAVPNAVVIYSNGNDWVMDATGREDIVIFKDSTNFSTWKKFPDPTVTNVTTSTNFGFQAPSRGVIDAVEIITPLETNRRPKRLPSTLDAAGTFVTAGQYSSQSLIRKTLKTVEGRKILQDTNNSANDFNTKTRADASKTEASFTTN